jgi:hypothetical protein
VGDALDPVAGDPALFTDVGGPHLAGLPDGLTPERIEMKSHGGKCRVSAERASF